MQTQAKERLFADTIIDDQIALERLAIDEGIAAYRKAIKDAIERGEGASTKAAERMLLYWCDPLVKAVKETQDLYRENKIDEKGQTMWGPPLLMLKPEEAAVITMQTATSRLMADHMCSSRIVYYAIGSRCLSHILAKSLRQNEKELWEAEFGHRDRISDHRVRWWAKRKMDELYWDEVSSVNLGGLLYALLAKNAHCGKPGEAFKPAFELDKIKYKQNNRFCQRTIARMTKEGLAVINEGHRARQSLRPRYLPMIVPPYKWSGDEPGGYISIRTPLVSRIHKVQKQAIKQANLDEFYDCFQAAQCAPWRGNKRIIETFRLAREGGGEGFGMPPLDDPPPPKRPDGFIPNTTSDERWKNVPADERKAYRRAIREWINETRKNRATRELTLSRMNVLDLMEKYDSFYLPHQLDFRGRINPIPAHLHHQTDDMTRSMLECGTAVDASDPQSKRWIAIHAANCWKRGGVDKLPFDERVEWVMDHLDQVVASARDPLDNRWWLGAKKPWQFLAACFAMVDDEAAARLPIHLDGTCNGLQWYAALARDERGAKSVNIVPGDRPESVYLTVAEALKRMVADDLASDEVFRIGSAAPRVSTLAKLAMPYCTIDLAKTPTMTTVYGVTDIGIRGQIRASLLEAGHPTEGVVELSAYLTSRVKRAIAESASGADAIMAWLRDCARLIVSDYNRAVRWTTPLGWPVVQCYYRKSFRIVRVLNFQLAFPTANEDDGPILRKQMDGVAANYIHSLDATHMFLTARRCRDEVIWFGPVHDSYWTHAATCDRLGQVLREEFCYVHGMNPLDMLIAEWRRLFPTCQFQDPPPRGTLDVDVVMDSPYFFS